MAGSGSLRRLIKGFSEPAFRTRPMSIAVFLGRSYFRLRSWGTFGRDLRFSGPASP
jgi:hypothetical protein